MGYRVPTSGSYCAFQATHFCKGSTHLLDAAVASLPTMVLSMSGATMMLHSNCVLHSFSRSDRRPSEGLHFQTPAYSRLGPSITQPPLPEVENLGGCARRGRMGQPRLATPSTYHDTTALPPMILPIGLTLWGMVRCPSGSICRSSLVVHLNIERPAYMILSQPSLLE